MEFNIASEGFNTGDKSVLKTRKVMKRCQLESTTQRILLRITNSHRSVCKFTAKLGKFPPI